MGLFAFVFIFSAGKAGSILVRNHRAEKAYSALRAEARQTAPLPAPVPAAAAPAEADPTSAEAAPAPTESPAPRRRNSMDIPALQRSYPELKGWIWGDGTVIDYPLMQSTDNYRYLNHLYDGTLNDNGAIFIDYRNAGLLEDGNTVIYGHNMDDGAIFAPVDMYRDPAYYKAHPTMEIYTPEGDWRVEFLSGTVENGDYEFVRFDFDDFADMSAYVSSLRSRSTFQSDVELREGDKLVSLCTCTYVGVNTRFMLVGRVEEIYE